jgi:hypothetical protein
MVEVRVGSAQPPLLIDRCASHHGLWFDKNELELMIMVSGSDKVEKIQRWLAGMFGKHTHD